METVSPCIGGRVLIADHQGSPYRPFLGSLLTFPYHVVDIFQTLRGTALNLDSRAFIGVRTDPFMETDISDISDRSSIICWIVCNVSGH